MRINSESSDIQNLAFWLLASSLQIMGFIIADNPDGLIQIVSSDHVIQNIRANQAHNYSRVTKG